MRFLSAILALLLLATAQPFVAAAGVLCGVKGKDCQASAVLGVQCCCETGCNCDGTKDRTTAPTQTATHDNPRLECVVVEMPMLAPAASEAELFTRFCIPVEWAIVHALPRVAVTCIRLN